MENDSMEFQKKQVIFSETMGICVVDEITRLAASKDANPILYYGLRSVLDRNKIAYVPVNNHQVLLRSLISKEEAMAMREQEDLTEFQKQEIEYVLSE